MFVKVRRKCIKENREDIIRMSVGSPLQGQKLPGTVRFAQPIGRRTVAVDTTKDNLEILILPFLRRLPEFSGSLLLRAAMKCNRLAD